MKNKTIALSLLLLFVFVMSVSALSVSDMLQKTSGNPAFMPVNVSVTGNLPNPGVFYLTSQSHVSEAIALTHEQYLETSAAQSALEQKANLNAVQQEKQNLLTPTVKEEQPEIGFMDMDANISLRNVILRRQGKEMRLDLVRYFRTGDVSQNPFLQEGDVIVLTSVQNRISIEGAVNKPASYELLNSDKLGDILQLAIGLKPEADVNQAVLYRFGADGKTISELKIPASELQNFQAGSGMSLKDGDRIFISNKDNYQKKQQVFVSGEAKFPGTYAIVDSVSLLDMLNRCGGPTANADLVHAQIISNKRANMDDPALRYLQLVDFNTTDPSYIDYMRIRSRTVPGRYAVNLQKLWQTQDRKLDIYLYDGDQIDIPVTNNTITVMGQVYRPGVYTWKEHLIWKDYIAQAGGLGWHADSRKIRVIRGNTGNWIKPNKETVIVSGDVIMVPPKADRTDWETAKDFLLAASQIITIIIGINAITTK